MKKNHFSAGQSGSAGSEDELTSQTCDVTSNVRKQIKDRFKRKCLSVFCCIALNEDADSQRLSSSSVTLTEEKWREIKAAMPASMTKEDFSTVLDKISGWVEAAVMEVFVPALQWSMEQNLFSSENISLFSSPDGVERGEICASPSDRISRESQRSVLKQRSGSSASTGSSCSLLLMSVSPFRSTGKSRRDEGNKPLVDLLRGLKGLSSVSCSDFSTAPRSEPLRFFFGITKDSIFSNVHSEVTSSVRNMLLPRMKDTLTMKMTCNLTSTLLDHSLMQMNSTLTEVSRQGSLLTGSSRKDVAQKLLFATMSKMLDFVQLSTMSDQLSASEGSPVNIHDELEEMLPLVTAKVVATVFESILNVCSEGTSEDSKETGSDTPLFDFVKAVHDRIKSDLFKAATLGQSTSGFSTWRKSSSESCSTESLIRLCSYSTHKDTDAVETPSRSSSSQISSTSKGLAVCCVKDESDVDTTVRDLPMNLVSSIGTKFPEVTSTAIYQSLQLEEYWTREPRSERVLETIIFNDKVNGNDDSSLTEMETQPLFRISCEAFLVEASERISHIIDNETAEITSNSSFESVDLSTPPALDAKLDGSTLTAASAVVNAVTGNLKSVLAKPSIDTLVFTEKVRMVSEKVLESTQATLKDVFLRNLLTRADAAMTAHDSAELSYSLLSGSRKVVKNIIESVTAKLPLSSVSNSMGALTRQFLQTLDEDLDLLFMLQLSKSSAACPQSLSDLIVTDLFEVVADKLISKGTFEPNETTSPDSVLKTLDRILSKDSIQQNSHELIPLVQNIILEGSAGLDNVKEKSSTSDHGSSSTRGPLNKKAQSDIVSGFVRATTLRLLQHCFDFISCCGTKTLFSLNHHHSETTPTGMKPELQSETKKQMLTFSQGSESKLAELSSELVSHVVESLPANLFSEVESRELVASLSHLNQTLQSSRDYEDKPATSKRQRIPPFRFPEIRFPKFRVKRWKTKVEPLTGIPSDCTQQRSFPTVFQAVPSVSSPADKSTKSLATSASTAVPVGKGKSLFSRVSKVFSKVFRK